MASSMDGVETTKLLKAKDFKVQGTQLLNEGKFKDANDMYQKILDTLGGKEMDHHETERKDLIQVLNKQDLTDFFVFIQSFNLITIVSINFNSLIHQLDSESVSIKVFALLSEF